MLTILLGIILWLVAGLSLAVLLGTALVELRADDESWSMTRRPPL
jgi:hypothetical protein